MAGATSGATSSASTALSTPRPSPSSRSALTASRGEGPRSPDACTSTDGTPSASSTPCSPTVSGSARCASWPSALGAPGSEPDSCRIASATVRCEQQRRRAHSRRRTAAPSGGARSRPRGRRARSRRRRRHGPRPRRAQARALRRRPRRRCRRWSRRARSCAWSRARRTRGRARAARPCPTAPPRVPGAAASRCATITIGVALGGAGTLRDDGRERALAVDRLRLRSGGRAPRSRRRRCRRAAQRARDLLGQALVAFAARAPLGIARGEPLQFGERRGALEGVGRERGAAAAAGAAPSENAAMAEGEHEQARTPRGTDAPLSID